MIVDRYIGREIIRLFSLYLLILIIIYAGYSSAVLLTQSANGLIQSPAAVQLIALKTIVALEVLLPTAFYLAVISVMSRLYKDSEIYALHAAGISQLQIVGAVFKTVLIIAVVVGFLSLAGRPWAYQAIYRLESQAIAALDINNIKAGQFIELQTNQYILSARDVDLKKGRLKDVFLQKEQDNQTMVIFAEEAYFPAPVAGARRSAEFYNAHAYVLDRFGKKNFTMHSNELQVLLQVDESSTSYKRKAESTGNLLHSDQPKDIAELQWRMSTSLATVLLALLGVPLSRVRPRQTRFYGFFSGILVYILLFSITGTVRTWVEQGYIDPVPGLWWAYTLPAGLLFVLLLQHQLGNFVRGR